MLINFNNINQVLIKYKIKISGALHVGAHECEELSFYHKLNLTNDDIYWVEAFTDKVNKAKNRGIPNIYNAVITDEDDKEIIFNVSNNVESSSVLEFGTHSKEHPYVYYTDKFMCETITIDTFVKKNNIDISKLDFWNLDIQGAELMALKGASESLKYTKAIYLEVNIDEVYKGCGKMNEIDEYLSKYGFVRVLTCMTPHGWGDALYIKSE
jgi:FkbM family methyltransferase